MGRQVDSRRRMVGIVTKAINFLDQRGIDSLISAVQ
jgi:hypothetical protein